MPGTVGPAWSTTQTLADGNLKFRKRAANTPQRPRAVLFAPLTSGMAQSSRSLEHDACNDPLVFALALILVIATSAEPVSARLVNEIVRALTTVRKALPSNFVVCF